MGSVVGTVGSLIGAKKVLGGPSVPGVSPLPTLPTRSSPSVLATGRRVRQFQSKRKGRKSTILTGPRGLEDTAPISRPRGTELLGG